MNQVNLSLRLLTSKRYLPLFLILMVGSFFEGRESSTSEDPIQRILATALVIFIVAPFFLKKPKDVVLSTNQRINPMVSVGLMRQLANEHYGLFSAYMAIGWFWFFAATFFWISPHYVKHSLFGDQSVLAMLLGVFTLGIIAGSVLCKRMSRKRIELGLVPFGSLGMSLFAVDLYFAGIPDLFLSTGFFVSAFDAIKIAGWTRIVFDVFGLAVFSGFFIVPLYNYAQWRTPPAERFGIGVASLATNGMFIAASAVIASLFLWFQFTAGQIFFVLACMNAAVAIYIYFYMPEFMLRFYAWCLTNIMYRMNVIGHERIPHDGPVVLVCNHVTYVDWLIVAAGVRRPLRFVMDHSFYKGWLLRTIMNQAKVIPIASAKESADTLDRAFQRIKAELESGEAICIFPEGRLTYDGEMTPFRRGVERILKESRVPVIPMALHNVWGSFFSRKGGQAIKKLPRRFWSAIALEIGHPIAFEDATAETLQKRVQDMLDRPARQSL